MAEQKEISEVLGTINQLMVPECDVREIISRAWHDDLDEFWVGLDLATNPGLDFGIERVPLIPEDDEEAGDLTFEEFHQLALSLAHEELLGPAAERAIEAMALRANRDEWNLWYRRILLKSLARHLPMTSIQSELIRLTTE